MEPQKNRGINIRLIKMKKEEIRAQAKKIIDEFMIALEKAEISEEKIGFDRKESLREPKKKKSDLEFK